MARCGNFRDAGLAYTGALKILQVILSYDYLWLNIRVKGRRVWLHERISDVPERAIWYRTVTRT